MSPKADNPIINIKPAAPEGSRSVEQDSRLSQPFDKGELLLGLRGSRAIGLDDVTQTEDAG